MSPGDIVLHHVDTLLAAVLAVAVAAGALRTVWRLWRQPAPRRPRPWRSLLLAVLSVASAVLLYNTLLPPDVAHERGTLVVLTANAGSVIDPDLQGEHVVALPEAAGRGRTVPALATGKAPQPVPVPDLATALRRYPGMRRIRVLGAGLVARDRPAAHGLALEFQPTPAARGVVALQSPEQVPVGRLFAVSGQVDQVPGGVVELLDPAGARVDRAVLADDGAFVLHAGTRASGPASYRLRLRDAAARAVDDLPVPVEVVPARPLRVLLLAGAPNAELKYLRRWALDAGLVLETRIDLGAGLQVGQPARRLDGPRLAGLDLLVLDERSWAGLGAAERAAIAAAVDRGLGVLLRMSAPLATADRSRLRAAGFIARSGGAARATRLGGGFVRAGEAVDAMPTVTRGAWQVTAADGVVALEDAAGQPLASWRAQGRGRFGVTTLGDSYRLVLGGRGDAHGEVWSRLFTTVARVDPRGGRAIVQPAPPRQRSSLCGVGDGARVMAPDGRSVKLQVDPTSAGGRCAAFWAEAAGWHELRDGDRRQPFHIGGGDAAQAMQAQALREATQAMAGPADQPAGQPVRRPGPRWPWFLAWLAVATAGWWFERSALGRAGAAAALPTADA